MSAQLRYLMAAFVALSAAFLVFSEEVTLGVLGGLDVRVHEAVAGLWWEPLHPLLQAVALLGGAELTSALAIGLAAYLWRSGFRAEVLALLAFPVAGLLEVAYKHFLLHPRPPRPHADGPSITALLSGPGGVLQSSYPSGHLLRAVIVYGLLAFVVSRLTAPRWAGRLAISLTAVMIATMAFDRLYLGVHWESDVVGGLLLGGSALVGAILWMDRPRV